MKGMIFTEFLDLVEEQYGLAVKAQIIRKARLPNDGAYTAVGNYDHAELGRLASQLSAATGTPLPQLLEAFGQRIFGMFVRNFGHFFARANSCFDFLAHIEDYIHVEVRKLYPDAELPSFSYPRHDDRVLVMDYRSPRPLGSFAKGLVTAAIRHYGEAIELHLEDLSDGAGTAMRFSLTRRGGTAA